MKKTVLFLMNGFGIEQKDSYNIYDPKLTPNLDKYTQNYLFSSIETNAFNYAEGYRLFSIGCKESLTYSLIDNYQEQFEQNSNMKFYLGQINKAKIQMFLFLESDRSLEHLKNLLKFIRTKYTNEIYLHLVLTSQDINNYKEIEKIVMKINYDYKDCKIATMIGINELRSNNLLAYMNMLQNHVGEKWRELGRKFISLTNSRILPCNMKEFYVNEGFDISENDNYFFFNYDYTDLTNFLTNITQTTKCDKFFSMFPIKGIKYPMFAFPLSDKYIVKSLEQIGTKGIILTDGRMMPTINYYANGLSNKVSPNLSFVRTEGNILFNKDKIKALIENSDYDLIILDYSIDVVKTIDELKDRLVKLDYILGYVHDICTTNQISLFISSLYGMAKEFEIDNYAKEVVNFSSKVPLIVIDTVYNKINFRIDSTMGVSSLADTVFTNINNKYNGGDVIIKKKGYLSKALKK